GDDNRVGIPRPQEDPSIGDRRSPPDDREKIVAPMTLPRRQFDATDVARILRRVDQAVANRHRPYADAIVFPSEFPELRRLGNVAALPRIDRPKTARTRGLGIDSKR